MKQSLRAKRMAKHHRRLGQGSKLNLVSLMDIFTILVFFLLLNSGDVEVLQADKSIKLPTSISDVAPENNLVISVSSSDLLVGGRRVAGTAELGSDSADHFAPLVTELNYLAERAGPLRADQELTGRPVTIMADESIPYHLLKKIMATCASADYRAISLAVTQMEVTAGEGN